MKASSKHCCSSISPRSCSSSSSTPCDMDRSTGRILYSWSTVFLARYGTFLPPPSTQQVKCTCSRARIQHIQISHTQRRNRGMHAYFEEPFLGPVEPFDFFLPVGPLILLRHVCNSSASVAPPQTNRSPPPALIRLQLPRNAQESSCRRSSSICGSDSSGNEDSLDSGGAQAADRTATRNPSTESFGSCSRCPSVPTNVTSCEPSKRRIYVE